MEVKQCVQVNWRGELRPKIVAESVFQPKKGKNTQQDSINHSVIKNNQNKFTKIVFDQYKNSKQPQNWKTQRLEIQKSYPQWAFSAFAVK
jgi:hypothetical protein